MTTLPMSDAIPFHLINPLILREFSRKSDDKPFRHGDTEFDTPYLRGELK